MKANKIVPNKKPYITQKYSRIIRLLLTNACDRKCLFVTMKAWEEKQRSTWIAVG